MKGYIEEVPLPGASVDVIISNCVISLSSDKPKVIEAMAELGLDLSKEFPKPLTAEAVEGADVVITMGCGDACPIFPGKRYLDRDLDDPSGKTVEQVRPIRDEMDHRVRVFLSELG